MCTRTKTSFGCGCAPKRTEDCNSRSCTGVARYHILNEGDCPECKRGGNRVTRGREGKGRYAQEIQARNAAPSPVVTRRPPLSPLSTNLPASPWAPPRPREKEWHSPVRQKADDAWLDEHERRQRDLDAKKKSSSNRPLSPRRSPFSSPPSPLPAKDHHHATRDPRRGDGVSGPLDSMAKLEHEIRRIEDAQRAQVRRRAERSYSYDSFDTMDSSSRTSPPAAPPSRGRTFDSGFHHHHAASSPYYSAKISSSSHHGGGGGGGLGRGLGDVVRDSAHHRSRW